jgi:hypothetical protein
MGTKYTNQTKWVQYINIGRFDYKYPIFSSKNRATRVKKKGWMFSSLFTKKKKKLRGNPANWRGLGEI